MAAHRELPELFNAVASDRENRVVILTGTGDTFISRSGSSGADTDERPTPHHLTDGSVDVATWDRIIWEGNRLVEQLLAIEVPVIAAVNGPVSVHSELAVLCDVVLAAEHAYFQDAGHFQGGLVPGDSMQIVWPLLLGPNRGRHFLLTGRKLAAEEARELGVVAEVLPSDRVLERAQEVAAGLARLNPILLRNTRHALVRPLRRAVAHDLHTGLALEAIASLSTRDWLAAQRQSAAPAAGSPSGDTNSTTVCIVATIRVQEGRNAEFEEVFTALAQQVRENEPGCLMYQLTKSRSEPDTYKVLEVYKDQAAVDHHSGTDYFKAASRKMGPCLAGRPAIDFLNGID